MIAVGTDNSKYRTILGVRFFQGSAAAAVDKMRDGGLLVVPAAPALKDIATDPGYREALVKADLALADSAFMVLVWNYLERDSIRRLSGLTYLRELLSRSDVKKAFNTVWVKANEKAAARNVEWLGGEGIDVPRECIHVAPVYGRVIDDQPLIELLERIRPQHVVITIGGGTQERLGLYLKERLTYRPAIHCVGAAIAFLSGDQVRIPMWADRFYMGWLFRVGSQPSVYVPRYWGARKLYALIRRCRAALPANAGA